MMSENSHTTRRMSDSTIGVVVMCSAMLLLPVGDALTKSLTTLVKPAEVAGARALVQAVVLFVALAVLRKLDLKGAVSGWSLISGVLIAVVSYSLITAFQVMPIATAISIFFVEPLLLTLLAGVFLGETPGPRRFAAIGVGMIGVLIILRPNFATFGPVVLLPLVAALGYALNMIVVRKATRTRSAISFQLGSSVVGAVVLALVAVVQPGQLDLAAGTSVPGWVWIAILAAGALSAGTFLMITLAFTYAEASVLAPFQYLEIFGAVIVGFLVFGDLPDGLTVLGSVVVLGSGFYVFLREQQQGVKKRKIRARADR